MESTATVRSCNTCHKPQDDLPGPLKACAKCRTTYYCSRDCQKEDWKTHKKVCASQAAARYQSSSTDSSQQATGSRHNQGFEVINELLGLSDDDYLHGLSEKEAMNQLIDCFRLRQADELNFAGMFTVGDHQVDEFDEFLDLAESRTKILPRWWNAEKRAVCKGLAVEGGNWSNISRPVSKADIQQHYNNPTMPIFLRILGEKIYGKGFM